MAEKLKYGIPESQWDTLDDETKKMHKEQYEKKGGALGAMFAKKSISTKEEGIDSMNKQDFSKIQNILRKK